MEPPNQNEIEDTDEEDEEKPFEGIFGNTPELKILEHLLALPQYSLTIRDVERELGLTRPTIQKVFKIFEKWNIIHINNSGTPKTHRLNMKERIVQSFDLVNYAIGEHIEKKEFGEILEISLFDIGIKKLLELNLNQEREKFSPQISADIDGMVCSGTLNAGSNTVTVASPYGIWIAFNAVTNDVTVKDNKKSESQLTVNNYSQNPQTA